MNRFRSRAKDKKLLCAAALIVVAAGCAAAGRPGPPTGAWLLIVPPMTEDGYPDLSKPWSKWRPVGGYASKIDCTTSMASQQLAAHRWYGPIWNAQTPNEEEAVQILNGRCIASDDPRLKSD
jgi:hypothetical protein